MTKIKRTTALFIILTLMVSMLVAAVPAGAEEITTAAVSDQDIERGVKLKTLGVITNEFNLSGYATRGEMAKIALDYISVPGSETSCFDDVPADHPYFAAIGALYNLGIISGDENGNFNPDEYVTYDEALVFIINAVGHKPFAQREGGYPTGYHRVAIKHDMLSDLTMQKGTDKAIVSDIYKMLEKALTAATVITSYYGDDSITYTLSDTETFLSTTYKLTEYRGIVTGTEATKLKSSDSDVKANQIEIDGARYDIYGYNTSNYIGCSVDFYISDENSDVIVYLEKTEKQNKSVRVDAEDILPAKTTATRIYYTDADDKEYHIDFRASISVIYNDQCYTSYGLLSSVLPTNGYVEALDNNRDGSYDVLFIYDYISIVAGTIDSYDQIVTDAATGDKYNLSNDDGQVTVVKFLNQDENVDFSGIQTGDVLSIAESKLAPKVINVYVSREIAIGTTEAYDSNRGYLIGDEWYKVTDNYADTPITLGMSGTFYLDMNDKIAKYEPGIAEDENTKLAVMAGIDYELGNFSNRITVKLYTEDEEFVDADLAQGVKINNVKYDISERADAETVLGAIGTQSAGVYAVNRAYVVICKFNDDKEVLSLDIGGIGGPGTLNALTTEDTNMLVRSGFILVYNDDSGAGIMSRYNTKDGIIFTSPADGELDKLEEYGIYKNFRQDHYYQANSTGYTSLETYAVYSLDKFKLPMADVILFRGMGVQGANVPRTSQLGVITDVTSAVDSDGMNTCRIYFGKEGHTLKSEVAFIEQGTTSIVPAESIASKLSAGTAVQFVKNNDGEVMSVKLVAKYDEETQIVTPMFSTPDKFIEDNYHISVGSANLVVGTVLEVDPESEQIFFTTNGTDKPLLYTSGSNFMIYRSDKKIVTEATVQDIVPGDKFVCRTERYYVPKDMIVYR